MGVQEELLDLFRDAVKGTDVFDWEYLIMCDHLSS